MNRKTLIFSLACITAVLFLPPVLLHAAELRVPNPPSGLQDDAGLAAPVSTAGHPAAEEAAEQEPGRAEQEENAPLNDSPDSRPTEIVSAAEANERSGFNALFIVIALVVGFAVGAGYISSRTRS